MGVAGEAEEEADEYAEEELVVRSDETSTSESGGIARDSLEAFVLRCVEKMGREVGRWCKAVGWLKVESAQVQRLKHLHEDSGFKRWFQLGACAATVRRATPCGYRRRSARIGSRPLVGRRCNLDPGLKAPPGFKV